MASASAASASLRRLPMFGRLPIIATDADCGAYPWARKYSTVSRSMAAPCMPAPRASAPTPNSEPISPSPAADNMASISACAATSPSESPAMPSPPARPPRHSRPANHNSRPDPGSAKRWASTPCPIRGIITSSWTSFPLRDEPWCRKPPLQAPWCDVSHHQAGQADSQDSHQADAGLRPPRSSRTVQFRK